LEDSSLLRQIEDGLAALELEEVPRLAESLAAFLELLAKWNRSYNLTAIRSPEDMVTRHLLDSLAVLPFIGEERVLDVGTGAGVPGLVLAMARPAQTFVLLDSSRKKTRFVAHAASRLGLKNVEVVTARAEAHQDGAGFGIVISRAFSAAGEFIRLAGHLASATGRLLAMKGAFPEAELASLPAGWKLLAAHRLAVPGLDERRHLLQFGRAGSPA
jgi:16S rRNA (guanine527-N7)-methyltransferase